jgi:sugar lactone lactonase YvrE
VTSCAFGGPDLATLYITTARLGMRPLELRREPRAGALFVFRPASPGCFASPSAADAGTLARS